MKLVITTMLIDDTPSDPNELEGYMALHRKMGYNYQVDMVVFVNQLGQGEPLDVSLAIENIGVAPFYYDWNVEYALLNADNQPVAKVQAQNYDLRKMMPNTVTDINGQIETAAIVDGEYRLGVRIIQSGSQDNKAEQWELLARNTYIVFSNDMPVIDGAWNTNALVGGWSILGTVTINQ